MPFDLGDFLRVHFHHNIAEGVLIVFDFDGDFLHDEAWFGELNFRKS